MGLLSLWLESLYEPNKITGKCLRTISHKCSCSLCVDRCPVQAIQYYEKGKLTIHNKKCNECQLCVTVCPPLAIEGMLPKRHYQDITLIIHKNEIPITERELLFFHKKGLRYLYFEEKNEEITSTHNSVNEQLAKLQLEPYEILKDPPEKKEKTQTTVTRREFFGNVVQSGKKNLLQNYTPAAWRNNQDLLKRAEIYPNLAIYEVQLNQDNCSLCGACSSLCPEGAIEILIEEKQFHIRHHNCTNCNLCNDICPDQAITPTPQKTNIHEESFYFLNILCEMCNNPFSTWKANETACIPCQIQKSIQIG